ncbi:MAG: class I SAM-dependent methyltransferase [bacterium]
MTAHVLGAALEADLATERARIRAEYARRELEVPADLWAPWQPAASFLVGRRRALAARLLHERAVFPRAGDRCLEVGCGSVGWLGELISWGLGESDLAGIDLEPRRLARARRALPGADLVLGDAAALPWASGRFALVIASTVLSSVHSLAMRRAIAHEMARVLRPDGAVLWYDLAISNPTNPGVQPVSRAELLGLFPGFAAIVRRATLAAPLARRIVPWSETAALVLEACPWLRTHWLAVLTRES